MFSGTAFVGTVNSFWGVGWQHTVYCILVPTKKVTIKQNERSLICGFGWAFTNARISGKCPSCRFALSGHLWRISCAAKSTCNTFDGYQNKQHGKGCHGIWVSPENSRPPLPAQTRIQPPPHHRAPPAEPSAHLTSVISPKFAASPSALMTTDISAIFPRLCGHLEGNHS